MSQPSTNFNQVLSDITNDLVGRFNLGDLLNRVVGMAMRLLNAEVCSIFLDDRDKPGRIVMMAGSGFAAKLVGTAEYETGEGLTGFIYATGRKFNINDRAEFQTLRDEATGKLIWKGKQDAHQWPSGMNEFRNLIALPLKIKNQIFGVIKVENKIETVGTCFSSEDETIFEIIANVVSLAIENARLYQQIEGQLKAISAKAAHRINNQAANYDAIELDLEAELQSEICNKENVRTITDRLKLSTRNLKKMIAEFKNYGKPLQLDKQPCSFNKIVQDEIWLARPPEAIIIDRDLDEKIPEVSIDAGRFAEAIKELISNALRAVAKNPGKGGRIHIQTHLASNTNPPVIVLSIEDTGPGFPLGLPLFQPFNSTDPQHIGVGLATVKELVRQHGGEIWAEKTDLGGARIQFTIPINP